MCIKNFLVELDTRDVENSVPFITRWLSNRFVMKFGNIGLLVL